MSDSRTLIREKTMFAIYGALIYEKSNLPLDPKVQLSGLFGCNYDKVDIFAREIYIKTLINKDEIVSTIQPFLTNWEFSRLNEIAQAILLLGVAEVKYCHLSDAGIAINAGVKMAKKYLDSKDYKYINAVLDKVLKSDGEC